MEASSSVPGTCKRTNDAPGTPSRPVKQRRLIAIPPTMRAGQPQAMSAQLGFFKLKGSPKRKARPPQRIHQAESTGKHSIVYGHSKVCIWYEL